MWPLDKNGNKIISQSVEIHRDEEGRETINSNLEPVVDENGLPIYYKNGGVTMTDNEWVTTTEKKAHEITRYRRERTYWRRPWCRHRKVMSRPCQSVCL